MQSQLLDFNLSNNYFSGEYHGERRRGALPRGSDAVQISLTGANHLRLNSAYNAGEYLVESRREALPRPSEAVEIPLTGTNHLHLNAGEYLGESRRRALPRPSDAVEISLTGGTHLQLNSYNAVPHDEELNELTIYGGNRFGPESSSSSELFFPTLGDNRLNHDYM
ncbi:hypothetical protein AQUCO_04100104v1 [Aquilegia coerulea]|uniref:Uncharacterized protein n=1 Tax=Aquilegia coerulea TaxID=218851 RepID=A0A2G5CQ59_AQUCA|nr:hypothetical protein AQUCO_04100104v1 [Aquilegia coerulea]